MLWTCYVLTLAAFWMFYEYRSVAFIFFYGSELLLAPSRMHLAPIWLVWSAHQEEPRPQKRTEKPTTHRDNAERHRLILNWDNRKCYNSIQQMLTRFRSRMRNYFILIRKPGQRIIMEIISKTLFHYISTFLSDTGWRQLF